MPEAPPASGATGERTPRAAREAAVALRSCSAADQRDMGLRAKKSPVRGAALQARIKEAQLKVRRLVRHPLIQGRICIFGLGCLQVLRIAAWLQNMYPALPVIGMHCLSVASDVGCALCSLPLFAMGTDSRCVQWSCLGPLVTMLFSMCVVDVGGVVAYFYVSPQRPIAPGYVTFLDRIMAAVSVWEAVLLASVALQMALMAAAWRIYAEMRVAGLYPPGNTSISKGETISHVSVLEIVCEAEDVALLNDCTSCAAKAGDAGDEITVEKQRYPVAAPGQSAPEGRSRAEGSPSARELV